MNLRKVISGCLAAVLVLTSVVRVSAATGFPDYDKNAWYAEAVSAAVENDLLRGANGRLNLQGDLTRGEMAAITSRAFGTYVKANISKFRDVPKDAWYYPDIQMAYFMGTYEGTGANTMAPDKPISRQEVMTVVARALQRIRQDEIFCKAQSAPMPLVLCGHRSQGDDPE